MTRARHVIPVATSARLDKIRKLIEALQVRPMLRDEIGALLKLSPSGVRKYLTDLRGKVEITYEAGEQVCRLTLGAGEVRTYLASVDNQALARPARRQTMSLEVAVRDPSRHIHIMDDDVEFKPRMQRSIPSHWSVMAHFYGRAPVEARA